MDIILYPDVERLADQIASSGNKAVMLCGISGCGKTTLADALARRGYKSLSTDRLIYDKYGSDFQKFPVQNQREITASAEKALADEMARLGADGQPVVADGCFCKRSKRDALRRRMAESGIKPLTVYLHLSLEETWERINNREGCSWRDIRITREMLENFFRGFEPPSEEEDKNILKHT